MHKNMIILLKKILINNNSIYHLGYIFYGTSIIIISIMIMMVSYSNLYKYNDAYSNKILNQKELVVEEYLANDNSKIINYNFTGNWEIQIDKYDFTTKDLNKIFDEQKYYISSVRDKKLVEEQVSKNDIIIPLAGIVGAPLSEKMPLETKQINEDVIKLLDQ